MCDLLNFNKHITVSDIFNIFILLQLRIRIIHIYTFYRYLLSIKAILSKNNLYGLQSILNIFSAIKYCYATVEKQQKKEQ